MQIKSLHNPVHAITSAIPMEELGTKGYELPKGAKHNVSRRQTAQGVRSVFIEKKSLLAILTSSKFSKCGAELLFNLSNEINC